MMVFTNWHIRNRMCAFLLLKFQKNPNTDRSSGCVPYTPSLASFAKYRPQKFNKIVAYLCLSSCCMHNLIAFSNWSSKCLVSVSGCVGIIGNRIKLRSIRNGSWVTHLFYLRFCRARWAVQNISDACIHSFEPFLGCPISHPIELGALFSSVLFSSVPTFRHTRSINCSL